MGKRLVIFLALLALPFSVIAQNRKNSLDGLPWTERVFFGGGGTFGGGVDTYNNRYTYFVINPMVGYRVTRPFSIGSFINYTLVTYPDLGNKVSQYGFSPYVQYRVGKIFGYAEYSVISVPNFDNTVRKTYTRFPVGLGYVQPLGPKAALNVMALYDLKYARSERVFASPWIIRVFISAGGISM